MQSLHYVPRAPMIANKHNDYVYFKLDFIHTFYIILLFI